MKIIVTGCVLVLAGAWTLLVAAPAAGAPVAAHAVSRAAIASDIIKVGTVRRKQPRRPHVDVTAYPRAPVSAPGCPGLYSWNPANPDRGFCDPGFAYHGNINGCVIDQGYGRWASCDSLR